MKGKFTTLTFIGSAVMIFLFLLFSLFTPNPLRSLGARAAILAAYAQSPAVNVKFVQITTGEWHTCGLTDAGEIKCWGDNYFGQLGNGNTADQPSFVDVTGLSATPIQVKAGYRHTCVLLQSKRAVCWGRNYEGQLGIGVLVYTHVPQCVLGSANLSVVTPTATSTIMPTSTVSNGTPTPTRIETPDPVATMTVTETVTPTGTTTDTPAPVMPTATLTPGATVAVTGTPVASTTKAVYLPLVNR